MRSFYFTLLIGIVIAIFCKPACAASQKVSNDGWSINHHEKNVLVLNAYHQNYHWADEIMRGVFSELGDKNLYELYVEYMDTKRCSDSLYYTQLRDIYKHKYQHVKIDAIVACDDNALNFMLMHRNEIFPGVPVSFCGVVDYHSSRIEGRADFTGVYETYDVPANIEMIRKFHPNTNRLVVISDVTESGKALIAMVKRAEEKFKDVITIDYLIDKKPDEIKEYLSHEHENTIVIWAIYLRLPDGQFISSTESIDFVSSITSLPIYCIWDVVGQGVVGGKITTPFYQGAKAASISKRILNGEKPSDIEVTGSPMLYKFDNNLLSKYNISLELLPNGSEILNQPTSFWQANKKLLVSLLSIIISLLLVVFTLGYLYRKSKRAEAEIKQKNNELKIAKQKAEESDRLKTIFLANLSHEIRTPMNGIIGFTEIIMSNKLPKSEVDQFIDIINKSGNRLLHLIDDLINISRIEANQVSIHPANTDLNDLLESVYKFYTPLANQKQLAFNYHKNFNNEVWVCIDKLKVEQVLINLLGNAFKFTTQGMVELNCTYTANELQFSVKDTGKGIKAEMRAIIFDRFNQVESSSVNGTEGMGLGLSICKSFVEKMGGSIWVNSELGKGSEFFIKLPLVTVHS
nr:ABC transporter substrate binding protein [uncultured Carboxylicivirga sp.]